MKSQNVKLIQTPVRLSCSDLWPIQRKYFAALEIDAWKKGVPFYISSNAFIGYHYALLVLNFIQDYIELHGKADRFYILETGTGTGKFSFYFLRYFKSLLNRFQMTDQKFSYIMTDIIENNLEFCKTNPVFAPFIESGELDFSILNVESDKDFYLQLAKKPYSEIKTATPLIVISNYTFDCIKQDAFEYKMGQLYELQMGLKSRYSHFDVEKPLHLDDLQLHYEPHLIDSDGYYEKPELNSILQYYENLFDDKEGVFSIPVGAIQFFDNLQTLTEGKYFVICGDKGVTLAPSLLFLNKDNLVSYDGCYAFMVNFDALSRYGDKQGMDSLLSQNENAFKVSVFSQGIPFKELKRTHHCFEMIFEGSGPDEYCYIFDEYCSSSYRFSLKGILSFLRLSHWDPDVFMAIYDRLMELLPLASKGMIVQIKKDLEKVKENIYPIRFGEDIYTLLGSVYTLQGEKEEAKNLYEKAILLFGDKVTTHYNLGIYYESDKEPEKALVHYQKALLLDKKNELIKKKVLTLTGKGHLTAVYPVLRGLLITFLIGIALYVLRLT